MTNFLGPLSLAPAGSTGNNSHASQGTSAAGSKLAVEFVVEAVGATPTVSYKLQATFDPGTVADASANWFDVILLPADNDTAAVAKTVTAAGAYVSFVAQGQVRFFKRVRLVTSSNTNVTYHANLYEHLG